MDCENAAKYFNLPYHNETLNDEGFQKGCMKFSVYGTDKVLFNELETDYENDEAYPICK